jgi:hypothetical protein
MTTTTIRAATDLESLLAVLRTYELRERRWTNLPTFGGAEPRDTTGVWSWDATRLLVGTCAADLRIVARGEE